MACAAIFIATAIRGGDAVEFKEYNLTLTLPPIENATTQINPTEDCRQVWEGSMGGSRIKITFLAFPMSKFHLINPDDALTFVVDNQVKLDPALKLLKRETVIGPYGSVAHAGFLHATMKRNAPSGIVDSGYMALCGAAINDAYAVEVFSTPPADAGTSATIANFLKKGIVYNGKVYDLKWTDQEALDRWKRDVPPEVKGAPEIRRTKHYIIFTNSSSGELFAKKMEECYDTIQKIYPFPETPPRRLMPVFLFRTSDQYNLYYSKIAGVSVEAASKSKGHAWRDYYATSYDAPNDPVHIHEATHQIFMNRLWLSGGGSWFQEGVAEFVTTKHNDRNDASRMVKKHQSPPLPEFVKIQSLLYSPSDAKREGDTGAARYKEAALLIEFFHEAPALKAKFPQFLAAIGKLLPNDADAIDAAFKTLYNTSIAEMDAAYLKYCESRN